VAHLLHIDSSIQGELSVSRKLTARALAPRFITAELTLADRVPAMAELTPLAERSLAEAERSIDSLWAPVPASA
jgi:FMN-dependent NADH-azoreductase